MSYSLEEMALSGWKLRGCKRPASLCIGFAQDESVSHRARIGASQRSDDLEPCCQPNTQGSRGARGDVGVAVCIDVVPLVK